MAHNSPNSPAAIRAQLSRLRERKAALDHLIRSVERYALHDIRDPSQTVDGFEADLEPQRLRGAA